MGLCVFYPVLRTIPRFQNPYQRIQNIKQFKSPVNIQWKHEKESEGGRKGEKEEGRKNVRKGGKRKEKRKEGGREAGKEREILHQPSATFL